MLEANEVVAGATGVSQSEAGVAGRSEHDCRQCRVGQGELGANGRCKRRELLRVRSALRVNERLSRSSVRLLADSGSESAEAGVREACRTKLGRLDGKQEPGGEHGAAVAETQRQVWRASGGGWPEHQ